MGVPRIVAVCGSLRDESYTRVGLSQALSAAAEEGAETELLDLRKFNLPVYDADRNSAGDASEFRSRIQKADGIILGTPVYHGSFSSPLKAALDYCRFEGFENKPVGMLAVSGGQFPTPALSHLQIVCSWLRAHPLPYQAGIPDADEVIKDGKIIDDDCARRVEKLGQKLVKYSGNGPFRVVKNKGQ